MGVFSDNLANEVRLERMKPEEIESAKSRFPAIYVAFGSIEWHGYHNAVGLDTLKAHEQLVGLAAKIGGLVYPAVYFGSGGGHIGWPSSLMVDSDPMIVIVTNLLHGFEADGYRKAILLSGHYPNRSEYLDKAIDEYRDSGGKMDVLAIVESQAPGVGGDHAAKFETSYMMYLHPDLVDMQRLHIGPENDVGGPEESINWMTDQHEKHPCYGLVGIDPRRHASVEVGFLNTERLVHFLEKWLTR
jgi:creatinine amidohydrolase